MPQQLTAFVTPISEPPSLMQGHFSQLSLSIHSANTRIQSQVDTLLTGTENSSFQGLGANAFSGAIDYYLGIANQHSLMLEQTSSVLQTCGTRLLNAVDTASASNPDSIIVNAVLSRVTLDQVVEQGSSPVETVLQEMRQTLHDMANQAHNYGNEMAKSGQSFGQAFSDFFHGNFGGAGHDFQQSWGDFTQSWSDLGQFMLDTGKYLWESIFEMTAAVLVQCAEDIWRAVKNCFAALGDLMAKAVNSLTKSSAASWEFAKDEAISDYDMLRGDYKDALLERIAAEVNPLLIMEGQQPLSQSQIQEMLPPSFWQWFKNLPAWAKVLLIGVVVAIIVGTLLWGTTSGKKTDQQRRIDTIRDELAQQGIIVKNAQIETLIQAGYSNEQIIAILKTADLTRSEDLFFKDGNEKKVYGHTLSKHVDISNTDLKQRARTTRQGKQTTTFRSQTIAQNAVNYAIANSATLQDFIHGRIAGNTATAELCYTTKPPPNLGYGCQ